MKCGLEQRGHMLLLRTDKAGALQNCIFDKTP